MYLIKKIFQLRDKANPDMEKPFLEHLEDLRSTITRILITLLIATLVCFALRDSLMAILRRPVERVWLVNQAERMPKAGALPKPLDVDTWEKAKRLADSISPLPPEERAAFFRQLDSPDLRFHVQSVYIYRAALSLPKDHRTAFLDAVPNLDPDLRKQVTGLLEKEPSALTEDREAPRMMGAFNPTEAFMLSIKLAFFAGIVVSFPLLLFFILQFVVPGLHKNEKRAIFPALGIAFALFIGGVLFAYFAVLPRVLAFFFNYGKEMGIANEWRIGYYISFATQFTLIFGLGFELPVVVMTLVKLGLLGYETMRNTRSYAILAIAVVAMVITPTPDAFTMCLLAVPMIILYEICIWLAWGIRRKELKREAAEEQERLARLKEFQATTDTSEPPDDDTPPPDDDGPPPKDDGPPPPDGDTPPDDGPRPDHEAGETEDRGDPPHETAAGTTVLPAADPWANPPADPPADDSIDSAADASHADSAQPGPPAPAKEEPRHPPE